MPKSILVAVTGGIAAYKACELVSTLIKKGYDVKVLLTKHALEFIAPLTFQTLTGHKVYTEMFNTGTYDIEHISLAKWADALVVVPATANCIAKFRMGIADDLLSTTYLAYDGPVLIAPAMNTVMYEKEQTKENIRVLKDRGNHFVEPVSGLLACKDEGIGKLAPLSMIEEAIERLFYPPLLKNKKILISAGPTREEIDPVRYITNHSTGKMGYALAIEAKRLGAIVTLVTGPTNLEAPEDIKCIPVNSACEMYDEILKRQDESNWIIMAAAVSDYKPREKAQQKIKKRTDGLTLSLEKNPDILKELGRRREQKGLKQMLCGFAMETEDLLKEGSRKLQEKKCDLICANLLTEPGAGFKYDTNKLHLITRDKTTSLQLMSKRENARIILEHIKQLEENDDHRL